MEIGISVAKGAVVHPALECYCSPRFLGLRFAFSGGDVFLKPLFHIRGRFSHSLSSCVTKKSVDVACFNALDFCMRCSE